MSSLGRHDDRLSQVPKPSKPQLLDSDTEEDEEEDALPVPAVRKSKAGVGRGGEGPGPALPGGKKSKAARSKELDQEFDRLLQEAPGKGKGRGKKTARPQQLLDQDSDTEEEGALAPPVRKNKAGGRGEK